MLIPTKSSLRLPMESKRRRRPRLCSCASHRPLEPPRETFKETLAMA
jgi:hypothetical protein